MEKKRILVIDDEKEFTELVKLNLEETGKYEVREENKGLHGFVAAKQFKPDLILLDILMPDLGGSEIAYQLKNDKETQDIPIAFLTAVITKEETDYQSSIIGGHPFIAKPVTARQLINTVKKIIGE